MSNLLNTTVNHLRVASTRSLRDLLALKEGVLVALILPEREGNLDQPWDRTGLQFVFCVLKVPENWMLYI